jgi:hypothetical protein
MCSPPSAKVHCRSPVGSWLGKHGYIWLGFQVNASSREVEDVNKYIKCKNCTYVVTHLPRIDIGPGPTLVQVRRMDTELETYVENVMERQEYRGGIFSNSTRSFKNAIIRGMAACKAPSWTRFARI